jgi:peptidyl-prolyl cis-trans isomerase C
MARYYSQFAGVRRAALVLSLGAAALTPAFAQTPGQMPMPGQAPAPAAAPAPKPVGKVLATVNGVNITDYDVAQARDDVGATLPKQMNDAARDKALLDYLIDLQLVSQKAVSEKMDQSADFQKKMAYYREKLLMEGYLGQVAKDGVTDAAMKSTYDEAAKAQKPEVEIHALHILVPTEEEAKTVEKRLKAGEDFGKLADELSKDPGTKGGDLGWFTKERMVPQFADAAFKLKVGEISPPVQTQFGWHVIKVVGKRQKSFPPLEQVKDQVEHFVAQRAQSQEILKLREAAKIKRFDESEAKPAAPTAAPAK